MAIIHYLGSSVDDLPGATAGYVDEDASWWVGVQKCGAQLALATALLLASSTAALATQVFSFHQDDPQLTAGYQDEQTWQNQVAPYVAPNLVPDTWSFDEQTPSLTAGYEDEGLWINPVQLVQSWIPPQFISDDQVIVPQPPTGIFDDNEIWQNQVAPYVAPSIVPVFGTDEQTPGYYAILDEDNRWISGVAPIGAYPVPQLFNPDELVGQPFVPLGLDEFYWQNPAAIVFLNNWQGGLPFYPSPDEIPGGLVVPPAVDPCVANPMPLPNGMDIFTPANLGFQLRHFPDGTIVQVRSDYALWCCACGRFISKSETFQSIIGYSEYFHGVF